MNIDTRKALELARDALQRSGVMQTHKAIDAIDAALSALAAPVAQGEPAYFVTVSGRLHLTDPTAVAFDLPDGRHALYTTPQPAPASHPVSEPSGAQINRLAVASGFSTVQVVTDNGAFGRFARAVLALRPVARRAPLTEADVLLRVIQRLNANPYSLTKSECISEIEAMRALGIGQEGGAA